MATRKEMIQYLMEYHVYEGAKNTFGESNWDTFYKFMTDHYNKMPALALSEHYRGACSSNRDRMIEVIIDDILEHTNIPNASKLAGTLRSEFRVAFNMWEDDDLILRMESINGEQEA